MKTHEPLFKSRQIRWKWNKEPSAGNDIFFLHDPEIVVKPNINHEKCKKEKKYQGAVHFKCQAPWLVSYFLSVITDP